MSVFGKSRTLAFILLFLSILCQIAPQYALALSMPSRPPADMFVMEATGYPESMDPHITYEEFGMLAVSNIYETLYTYPWGSNATEPLVPLLAAETPLISPDGLNYTIKLRENVTFHDNTPFNASCVKWNFERLMKISYEFGPAYLFGRVLKGGSEVVQAAAVYGTSSFEFVDAFRYWVANSSSIDVLDPYRVQFTLERPYSPFPHLLAHTGASMISPSFALRFTSEDIVPPDGDWREHYGIDFGQIDSHMDNHTCGTGPYMLTDFLQNEFFRLDQVEAYWRTRLTESDITPSETSGAISTVFIKTYPDAIGRTLNLRTGMSDYVDWPRANVEDIWDEEVQMALDLNVNVSLDDLDFTLNAFGFPLRNITLVANATSVTTRSPFANQHFRRVVCYAFDYDGFIAMALHGLGVQGQGPIPQGMMGHNSSTYEYVYNTTAAVEEWNAAVQDPLFIDSLNALNNTIVIPYVAGSSAGPFAEEFVKDGLEQVLSHPNANRSSLARSMQFILEPVVWSTYFEYMTQNRLPLISSAWRAEIAHPLDSLSVYCDHMGEYAQRIDYNNTDVNLWYDAALAASEDDELQTYCSLIQETIAYEAPYLWVHQQKEFRTWRAWVEGEGLVHNPMRGLYFYEVYKTYIMPPDALYTHGAQAAGISFLLACLIFVFLVLARDQFRGDTLRWRSMVLAIYSLLLLIDTVLIYFVNLWTALYSPYAWSYWYYGPSLVIALPLFGLSAICMGIDIYKKDNLDAKFWLLILFIFIILASGAQPVFIFYA